MSNPKYTPRVIIEKNQWDDTLSVGVRWKGKAFAPIQLVDIEPGYILEPCFIANRAEIEDFNDPLQAFMDALWNFGYRPYNKENYANELTATKYHLEDMRSLVFKAGQK